METAKANQAIRAAAYNREQEDPERNQPPAMEDESKTVNEAELHFHRLLSSQPVRIKNLARMHDTMQKREDVSKISSGGTIYFAVDTSEMVVANKYMQVQGDSQQRISSGFLFYGARSHPSKQNIWAITF